MNEALQVAEVERKTPSVVFRAERRKSVVKSVCLFCAEENVKDFGS